METGGGYGGGSGIGECVSVLEGEQTTDSFLEALFPGSNSPDTLRICCIAADCFRSTERCYSCMDLWCAAVEFWEIGMASMRCDVDERGLLIRSMITKYRYAHLYGSKLGKSMRKVIFLI